MKVIRDREDADEIVGVELTRRNLEVLLAKLDDPNSARTLVQPGLFVHAVENDVHYGDREPGPMLVDGALI